MSLHFAECHYAELHFAECRHTEWHFAYYFNTQFRTNVFRTKLTAPQSLCLVGVIYLGIKFIETTREQMIQNNLYKKCYKKEEV